MPGFRATTSHPVDATNWGTVATRGATSWIHVDHDGFSTSTQPLTGSKYWVIFYRDPAAPADLGHGNMASIDFCPNYDHWLDHAFQGYMTAEAVVLRP
jgi:hypothetical protein